MRKIIIFSGIIWFFSVSLCFAQGESINITTYYPSPYGSYRELTWGNFPNTRGTLSPDQGSSIELGGSGTPYIDFSNDMTVDYDVRLRLTGNDTLALEGGTHDIAELIPAGDGLEPGDVVVIDKKHSEKVIRSTKPYDKLVAGIYSSEPGFLIKGSENYEGVQIPLALVGRVLARASSENGSIEIGDLLVTSSTPGHVMKCTDYRRCQGGIVGKALESLAEGKGKIKILVTLQ